MKKWPYVVLMVVLSASYIYIQQYTKDNTLGSTITVVLAIVAAIAFWMEFRSGERLNEAKFIMDLNNQFISNPELTEVEYELEKYYVAYGQVQPKEREQLCFSTEFGLESKKRQWLVNYLVHLEGIAALVNRGVLHLDVIDDLMAYRYFLAVNNPVVQKIELIPYRDYYKGCFDIYERWKKAMQGRQIPLEESDLLANAQKSECMKQCSNK